VRKKTVVVPSSVTKEYCCSFYRLRYDKYSVFPKALFTIDQ